MHQQYRQALYGSPAGLLAALPGDFVKFPFLKISTSSCPWSMAKPFPTIVQAFPHNYKYSPANKKRDRNSQKDTEKPYGLQKLLPLDTLTSCHLQQVTRSNQTAVRASCRVMPNKWQKTTNHTTNTVSLSNHSKIKSSLPDSTPHASFLLLSLYPAFLLHGNSKYHSPLYPNNLHVRR